MVTIPLGLWLCGAGPSASVDLNRYLSGTLTAECNRLIRENPKRVVEISSSQVNLSEFRERLRKLVEFLPRWRFAGVSRSDQTCNTYLRRMPGDCRFRNIHSMSIFLTPSSITSRLPKSSPYYARRSAFLCPRGYCLRAYELRELLAGLEST